MEVEEEVLPWEEYKNTPSENIEVEFEHWEEYTDEDKEALEILADLTGSKLVILDKWEVVKRKKSHK